MNLRTFSHQCPHFQTLSHWDRMYRYVTMDVTLTTYGNMNSGSTKPDIAQINRSRIFSSYFKRKPLTYKVMSVVIFSNWFSNIRFVEYCGFYSMRRVLSKNQLVIFFDRVRKLLIRTIFNQIHLCASHSKTLSPFRMSQQSFACDEPTFVFFCHGNNTLFSHSKICLYPDLLSFQLILRNCINTFAWTKWSNWTCNSSWCWTHKTWSKTYVK